MTRALQLDPKTESHVESLLVEHFTRLGYPDVASASRWSLSIDGAEVRFKPLMPFLAARIASPPGAERATPASGEGAAVSTEGIGGGLRILVSGMGSGSEMIVARNLGFGEVHGTEVDPFYVSLVSERLAGHPGFFPIPVDGKTIPYGNAAFDIVVSGHIVEHTSDPASYIADHLRVLKPGGYFLVEFPTRYHTRELHTGLPSLEWLPDRLRTAILRSIGSGKGLIGRWKFSDSTRTKCRAITETALKQVSLGRVRRWAAASGTSAKLVAKGRPGPGVVYGLFQRTS